LYIADFPYNMYKGYCDQITATGFIDNVYRLITFE